MGILHSLEKGAADVQISRNEAFESVGDYHIFGV